MKQNLCDNISADMPDDVSVDVFQETFFRQRSHFSCHNFRYTLTDAKIWYPVFILSPIQYYKLQLSFFTLALPYITMYRAHLHIFFVFLFVFVCLFFWKKFKICTNHQVIHKHFSNNDFLQEIFHCNIGQYYSISTHASDLYKLQHLCHVDKIRQSNCCTFYTMKSEL